MKRHLLALFVPLLTACGGDDRIEWTILSKVPESGRVTAYEVVLPFGTGIMARPTIPDECHTADLTTEDPEVLDVERLERGSFALLALKVGTTTLHVRCKHESFALSGEVTP